MLVIKCMIHKMSLFNTNVCKTWSSSWNVTIYCCSTTYSTPVLYASDRQQVWLHCKFPTNCNLMIPHYRDRNSNDWVVHTRSPSPTWIPSNLYKMIPQVFMMSLRWTAIWPISKNLLTSWTIRGLSDWLVALADPRFTNMTADHWCWLHQMIWRTNMPRPSWRIVLTDRRSSIGPLMRIINATRLWWMWSRNLAYWVIWSRSVSGWIDETVLMWFGSEHVRCRWPALWSDSENQDVDQRVGEMRRIPVC